MSSFLRISQFRRHDDFLRGDAVSRLRRLRRRYLCVRCADVHQLARVVRSHYRSNSRTGLVDDANGEIGDICAWQTKKVDRYTVQLEWSNQANRCV